jgi:DNA invertase Pin-like site-specific DNA recombinase
LAHIAAEPKLGLGFTPSEIKALDYLRTSSAANVEGDSSGRQRAAIRTYAARNGVELIQEFYDAAVSGADPVQERPGFAAMLDRIEGNGVKLVMVEDASRFARDLVDDQGRCARASRRRGAARC